MVSVSAMRELRGGSARYIVVSCKVSDGEPAVVQQLKYAIIFAIVLEDDSGDATKRTFASLQREKLRPFKIHFYDDRRGVMLQHTFERAVSQLTKILPNLLT